ncbi:TPA: hypothetical protein ACFRG8_000593 [Neisseria lactamica]|nr:hypothetical protein [Neisseria lactamica]
MPSEGSDGIGGGESAGCRVGFSPPIPSTLANSTESIESDPT